MVGNQGMETWLRSETQGKVFLLAHHEKDKKKLFNRSAFPEAVRSFLSPGSSASASVQLTKVLYE